MEFNKIINKGNIFFAFVVFTTLMLSGAAGAQLIRHLIPVNTNKATTINELTTVPATPTNTVTDTSTKTNTTPPKKDTSTTTQPKVTTPTPTPEPTPTPPAKPTVTTFNASDLKSHASSSSCYVAYNGKVYDVTNDGSWRRCYHHGVPGGIDITSIFPHPLYYLDTLPIVGNYSG